MKKLALLLALCALTSAHAAEPTAVWSGSDLADNVTKGGMTLHLNTGNTASGGVITIGSSAPVYIETGLTSSSVNAGVEATVVLTWENVNPGTYGAVATFTTSSQSDAVGVECYGYSGTENNTFYWIQNSNYSGWSSFYDYPSDLASHKVAFACASPSSGTGTGGYNGSSIAVDGEIAGSSSSITLASGYITRINVGGYQTKHIQTGARITRIAVYTSALSTADLKSVTVNDDPEPEPEEGETIEGAVWGNVGNTSASGVATTVSTKSYSSLNVDFGAIDNISQTVIGSNGWVKITKVRLFADNNATAKPATITISQGDTEVASASCSFVASQKIYGAYWPATTTHYWTRKAIDATFTSETLFDTTKPITISFDETTICGIQPVNSVCVGSSYSPAIEITGDYTKNIEEKFDPMYLNRLSTGDEVIDGDMYGKITVPENGFKATAFTALTKLSNTASESEIEGSYAGIIKNGTYVDTHTVAGWFKVNELPPEGNITTIYFAQSHSVSDRKADHAGYQVAVDAEGRIRIGKVDYTASSGVLIWNGSYISTTDAVVTGGTWFHLAVANTKTANATTVTPQIFVNGDVVAVGSGTFAGNLNGNGCSALNIGAGVSASGIYVDKAALKTSAAIVAAALSTPVEVEAPQPKITKDPSTHTWIVDTTKAEYTFTSDDISDLKTNTWKVTLRSQSDYSATINFDNQSSKQLSHFIIESGEHNLTWYGTVESLNFTTDGKTSDPSILVKSGATLNFTARDITGWKGAASNKSGNVIRVNEGGVLNLLMNSSSQTHYYQGRYYLDPGATINADSYSSNKFRLNGGATENYEQLYVPNTTNGAPAATLSAVNGLRLASDSTAGLGVFVGENAELDIDANITSDGARPLTKWGAGMLALNGALTGYTGALTVNAGTLKLAKSTLGGSLTMVAGTALDLHYDGVPTHGTVVLTATSIAINDNVQITVDGVTYVLAKTATTLTIDHAVAKVGDKAYGTIIEAAKAAGDGGVMTLLKSYDELEAEIDAAAITLTQIGETTSYTNNYKWAEGSNLIVTEIMPKPSDKPDEIIGQAGYDKNGLESGWVELLNTANAWVDLKDYKFIRVNRSKANSKGDYGNFPSAMIAPGERYVFWTSERYANSASMADSAFETPVDEGKPHFFPEYNMMVWPDKVNPKKFAFVRFSYNPEGGTEQIIDTVVIPSDIPEGYSIIVEPIEEEEATVRYLCAAPTQGTANPSVEGLEKLGPNIGPLYEIKGGKKHASVSEFGAVPPAKTTEAYTITFALNPTMSPTESAKFRAMDAITDIKLVYRLNLDDTTLKTNTVELSTLKSDTKDQGDQYTATIPAEDLAGLAAGRVIQWKFLIADKAGNEWTSPSFHNPDDGYEWYGTITEPGNLNSANLPTWHMFLDSASLAQMDTDADDQTLPNKARAAIYDSSTSNYYDYVRIDLRGNTSARFSKKSHGFRFAKAHPLTMRDIVSGKDIEEIRKTSLIGEPADPSYLRQLTAFWLLNRVGSPAPFDFPVRVNRNGEFYQLAFNSERFSDELIEDVYKLDKYGYSYKNVGTLKSGGGTTAGGIEKKTPDDGNDSDISVLQNELRSKIKAAQNVGGTSSAQLDGTETTGLNDAALTKVVVQRFDLPAWFNYLAITRITQEMDDVWANISVYYDNPEMKEGARGTGTWMPLAYDMNLSFGQYYHDAFGARGLIANLDWFKGHPFYGSNRVRCYKNESFSGTVNSGNDGFESVYQNAKFRRLYLRRLRTLMDQELKAPGTDETEVPLMVKMRELAELMRDDTVIDKQKWPHSSSGTGIIDAWGNDWPATIDLGIDDIWQNYIQPRQTHLYVTHSVTNVSDTWTIGYGAKCNAGIPEAQSPIADLKDGFSATFDEVSGMVAIQNANDETVDMSGWELSGPLAMTLPMGTVVDSNDCVYVVADRRAYVAAIDAEITDQIIVGNGELGTDPTAAIILKTADGTPVIAPAEKSEQEKYLRLWGFCGVPDVGDDGEGEFIIFTNLNQTAELDITDADIQFEKTTESKNRCHFKLSGKIAAGGWVRFNRNDIPWDKITNGIIDIKLTAANNAIIYSTVGLDQEAIGVKGTGYFAVYDFSNDTWGKMLITEAPGYEPPKPPAQDIVLTGSYPEGTNITLTADTTIVVSNATFNAALAFTGDFGATITLPADTASTVPQITSAGKLVFAGEGKLTITGEKELIAITKGDLVVDGGELVLNATIAKEKDSAVLMMGSYLQTGGKVTLNLAGAVQAYGLRWKDVTKVEAIISGGEFVANIESGTGSAAFKANKGSNDFTLSGGKLTASIACAEGKVVDAAGNIKIKGTGIVDVTGVETATHARVFKTEKKVTISDTATVDVKAPGVESEAFSADNQITIEGGIVRVEACDDCFSAQTNIVVSGGIVYGHSISNDVFDSNGTMTISGGTIIAYTLAEGHEAFDTEPATADEQSHTFTITGGTIVGLGGKNAAWPTDSVFEQKTATMADLDPATYSEKYLVVDGVVETLYAKLPKIEDDFIVLATIRGLTDDPTVATTCPVETPIAENIPAWRKLKNNQQFLRFAEIYGNTLDGIEGDTGEYFVLTNVSANVVYLKDLEIEITKADKKKKDSKCNFKVPDDLTVEPHGAYTFEQTTWGWTKITNGDLRIVLTDADGKTVQSGTTSNNFYPECDGNGASLIAKTFDKTIAMTTDDWEPSFRWFYFTIADNAATITGFGTTKLAETTLTLPRELGKVPVTLVDEGAFADCALTTLKVTLTNETLKVMATEGVSIAQYDMSESEGELVLGYALGSILYVSGTTVLGSSAATLAFDLGEGVTQEVKGTTSDAAKQYGLTVKSGTLNFTSSGGATSFCGRIVTADGENAIIKLSNKSDTTGYSNPAVKIVVKNGGTMQVGKRDTLTAPIELDNGEVMLMAGCADTSGRGLDLYNANGNNWTIGGTSTLAVDSGAQNTDSGKVLLRNGNWNVNVTDDALFAVDATVISEASSAGGTRGKIVKTGAGTLYLAATNNAYATATEVVAGTLKLAQSSLAGALTMNAGTTLDLQYAGTVEEGAEVFSAASIVADGVTFIVNGKPLPEGLTLNAENGKLVVGKPKATEALNPYAVRDGVAIKVSCNEGAENAANAYDGDTTTYFDPGDTANANGNSWAGIEFTNGVIVTRIAYACRSGKMYRMVGGVFQGANTADFSDAETICVVDACPAETADVTLAEAKGPYKYLRFIGMYGGNVAEITYYGLANSGTEKPTTKPDITGESVEGVAQLTLTADATIPQVYIVQRAMRNFCEDETDYESFVTFAPRLGETVNWTDSEATPYAMYRAKGMNANGSSDWTYFTMSPEALINGPAAPSFKGDKPGFYTDKAVVTINYDYPGAKIYYTLDGSTPTTNSIPYPEGGITLEDVCSNTNNLANIPTNPSELWSNNNYGWKEPTEDQPDVNVIRARAFTEDGAGSTNEVVGTWMIGPTVSDHLTNGLRVVSIVTDKANFFSDPTGIMVPGDVYKEKGFGTHPVGKPNANYFQKGIEWERPVFVNMFESDGKEMFSAKMGARAHGNVSRAIAKKTLNFYLRKEYEQKNLKKVKLFNDDPDHQKFKRFALRNGGNDWRTLNMRDAFGQSVFRGDGIDTKTDTQGYEPVVMYINGEYWGLYNLRHAYSKHYFEDWHGATEDDVDYIKMFPGEDGSKFEIQEGDGLAIRDIMQYMVTCTTDGEMSDEEFAKVEEQVDIDSMMDYYIVRFFLANGDSMNGNNMSFWRSRSGADTKWHFAIYDCDEALSNSGMDMFTQALNRSQDTNDSGSFYEPCFFKRCYMNVGFKKRFANRYADLLNTALKADRTTNLFAKAVAKVTPEMERTVARWLNMGTLSDWQGRQSTVKNFFINRPSSEFSHIKSYCNGGDYANITITTNGVGKGKVTLNTITSGEHFDLPFTGKYFTNIPVTLTAKADSGSAFEGWMIDGQIVSAEKTIELVPIEGVAVQAVFAEAGESEQKQYLRLWGICGAPDGGAPDANEFIIFTNLNQNAALDISGAEFQTEKNGAEAENRCHFFIANGTTIPAGGWIRFNQADIGWTKITDNKIDIWLKDSDGTLIYQLYLEQEALGVRETGSFAVYDNAAGTWSTMLITEAPGYEPPPPAPETTVITGVVSVATSYDGEAYIISNATLNAKLSFTNPAGVTLTLADATTGDKAGVIYSEGPLTIKGDGTLSLSGETELMNVGGLTINGGTLNLTAERAKKIRTVVMRGNYYQNAGTVTLKVTGNTAEKNALGFSWENCTDAVYTATLEGTAVFNATMTSSKKSDAFRSEASGVVFTIGDGAKVTANFSGVAGELIETDADITIKGGAKVNVTSTATGGKVLEAEGKITVKKATIDITATGADTEAFSAGDTISIENKSAVLRIKSTDDCFNAQTNILVSAGTIYGHSISNDVFDSNGAMTISGGTIVAYTLAYDETTGKGHTAFDTECYPDNGLDHTFKITGGTVIGLGGKNGAWPTNCVFSQGVYTNMACAAADYSNKYLKLETLLKDTIFGLPEITDEFVLLTTTADWSGEPTVSDTAPTGEPIAKGVPVWVVNKSPQQALRIIEIYGSTSRGTKEEGNEGDVGEFVVITNMSNKAVDLKGMALKSEKFKSDKYSTSFDIAMTNGQIAANGTYKLLQEEVWPTNKITNGSIRMTITDNTGTQIQEANLKFKDEADQKGASMLANNLNNPCNDWYVGPIHDPAGPTPAPGSESAVVPTEEPNTYIVTPTDETKRDPVIQNVKDGDTLIINGGAVDSLTVDNTDVTIKVMNTAGDVEITKAVKGFGEGLTFSTELDATKTVDVPVESGTEPIKVQPELANSGEAIEPFVVGDDASVGVKTIPGLTYRLLRMSEIGGATEVVATEVATSARTELKDDEKPADKAFYKVQVTK